MSLIDILTQRSIVQANADVVWRRVTDPIGINAELFPILRMSVPNSIRGKGIEKNRQYLACGLGRMSVFCVMCLAVARSQIL